MDRTSLGCGLAAVLAVLAVCAALGAAAYGCSYAGAAGRTVRRFAAWFFGPGFPNPSNVFSPLMLGAAAVVLLRGRP